MASEAVSANPPAESAGAAAATVSAPPLAAAHPPAGTASSAAADSGVGAGDVAGGLAGAATNFALAVSLGMLAFAPLGARYFEVGIYAGFASAIYGQLVAGLMGGAAHPGSGPRASTTMILAAMIAVLANDPALAPSATQGPGFIVAIAGATVVVAGIAQVILGAVGAGSSLRFVPFPFVAGFMTGVSALVIIAQVAPLSGITRTDLAAGPVTAWQALQPATLFVGLPPPR